jgi:hypothetical protein
MDYIILFCFGYVVGTICAWIYFTALNPEEEE